MIGNFESSKTIISKILRDIKPTHKSWINDVYEWIFEVIEYSECIDLFQVSCKKLPITNSKILLNFPFESIINIEHHNLNIYKSNDKNLITKCKCDFNFCDKIKMQRNGNVIHFNIDEGEIKINYLQPLVDEQGYPLIPSDFKFKEAVLWYVLYKLILQGYQHPLVTLKEAYIMYEDFLQKYINSITLSQIDITLFKNCWLNFDHEMLNRNITYGI